MLLGRLRKLSLCVRMGKFMHESKHRAIYHRGELFIYKSPGEVFAQRPFISHVREQRSSIMALPHGNRFLMNIYRLTSLSLPPKVVRTPRLRSVPRLFSNLSQYRVDVWQLLPCKGMQNFHNKLRIKFLIGIRARTSRCQRASDVVDICELSNVNS